MSRDPRVPSESANRRLSSTSRIAWTTEERATASLRKNSLGLDAGRRFTEGIYLPRAISWVGTEIALAIGGTTYPRQDGAGKSYCYGVIVSSETLHISRVLSAPELRSSYQARCRVMA